MLIIHGQLSSNYLARSDQRENMSVSKPIVCLVSLLGLWDLVDLLDPCGPCVCWIHRCKKTFQKKKIKKR